MLVMRVAHLLSIYLLPDPSTRVDNAPCACGALVPHLNAPGAQVEEASGEHHENEESTNSSSSWEQNDEEVIVTPKEDACGNDVVALVRSSLADAVLQRFGKYVCISLNSHHNKYCYFPTLSLSHSAVLGLRSLLLNLLTLVFRKGSDAASP